MRADNNCHMRVHGAGFGHNLTGFVAVRDCQQQGTGTIGAGKLQYILCHRIPHHGRVTAFSQLFKTGAGIFHHHNRIPFIMQLIRQHRTDAAITDNNSMSADIDRHLGDFFQRFFFLLLFRCFGFFQIAVQQCEQHRVEHDRDNRTSQDQVIGLAVEDFQRDPHSREDKGEFPDLRETDGDCQRCSPVMAEHPHQQQGGGRFTDDNDCQHTQYAQRMVDQHHWVKQHPDRDKEQHSEGITQRQSVLCGPVAEF